MSPEEIHSDLDITQAEMLVLKESRALGLEKHEGLTLRRVKITFEKIEPSRKRICNPNIDDECILHIKLRDTNLISGIKLYFATLANMLERGPSTSPFLLFIVCFLYPVIIFDFSLVLVILFFTSDFFLSLLFGPIMFTAFIIPSLFWITFRNRDQKKKKDERVKSKLAQVYLFTNEHDIMEYSQLVSGRNLLGPAMSFTMYITLLIFLFLTIILGSV